MSFTVKPGVAARKRRVSGCWRAGSDQEPVAAALRVAFAVRLTGFFLAFVAMCALLLFLRPGGYVRRWSRVNPPLVRCPRVSACLVGSACRRLGAVVQSSRHISAALICSIAGSVGAPVLATDGERALPAWFLGVWQREWIRHGVETESKVTVRFLQTPTMFGDVRIPKARPPSPRAKALADLADSDLALLAEQRGFFGYTTIDGNVATWHHEIDYQPPDGSDDIGRLERAGPDRMFEHALDESYVEAWQSLTSGDGKFLVVRATKGRRLDRVLLVAGDHFLYARNRPRDLPPAASLADLIAKSHAPRETVLAYLDCELSHGLSRGGRMPWEIVNSTLPWREGSHLEFADLIFVDSTGRLSTQDSSGSTWEFPLSSFGMEDLLSLFKAKPD